MKVKMMGSVVIILGKRLNWMLTSAPDTSVRLKRLATDSWLFRFKFLSSIVALVTH